MAGFAKMVEYEDFRAAAAHHAPVAAGRDLIFAGACIVGPAVCAAGLVFAAALVRDLRRGARVRLVRPLLAVAGASAVLALGLGLLVVYAHTASPRPPHDPRNLAVVGGWLFVSAAAVGFGLGAAGRLVSRVAVGPRGLRLVVAAAWAAAAGMCITAAGLVLWGIALASESAPVFGLRDGGLPATPTAPTWAAEMLLGVGAAALAVFALRRAGASSPPASRPPAGRGAR